MSVTSELVLSSVKAAIDYANAERKDLCADKLAMYYDKFKALIESEIDKQFATETASAIKLMIDDSNNIFKRIIKEISTVYKAGAKRAAKLSNGEADERYSELISAIPFDIIMSKVNALTNACNELLVKVTPRNGRVELDLITADAVDAIPRDDDCTRPKAIVYRETHLDTYPDGKVQRFVYWDIFGKHCVYDSEMNLIPIPGNPDNINPFKDPDSPKNTIIPILICHRSYNDSEIFDSTSGEDIYSLTKQVGVKLTYLNHLIKLNSFKQLAMTGVDPKELNLCQISDPLYPKASSNADASITVLDWQIDLMKVWSVIQEQIVSVASNWGLSAETLKMSVSATSGFALEIKREGLTEVRMGQIPFYRWYESDLFKIMRIVNNYEYPKKPISDDAVLSVDFIEPATPTDGAETRANWAFWLKTGARSIADFVRFINPDIQTDEDAMKLIKKNSELNKLAMSEYGIDLAGLLSQAGTPQTEEQNVSV